MMTSSNGTFSALLALCARISPVTGEFPSQRPVTWSFDVFFDLHLNKRLSKQPKRGWFETHSCSLWRHCNEHSKCHEISPAILDDVISPQYSKGIIEIQLNLTENMLNFSVNTVPGHCACWWPSTVGCRVICRHSDDQAPYRYGTGA